LVTLGAARTIGLGEEVGALAPGRWGDLVELTIPAVDDADQLFEAVLAATPNEVLSTRVGGREVYRRLA
ncbi:MAG TPA: hypothetical protein VFI13_09125, partial [Gemmatimonadales bacterium]|nr:hypothetical protein [Gemmatimonadales bacterium]